MAIRCGRRGTTVLYGIHARVSYIHFCRVTMVPKTNQFAIETRDWTHHWRARPHRVYDSSKWFWTISGGALITAWIVLTEKFVAAQVVPVLDVGVQKHQARLFEVSCHFCRLSCYDSNAAIKGARLCLAMDQRAYLAPCAL